MGFLAINQAWKQQLKHQPKIHEHEWGSPKEKMAWFNWNIASNPNPFQTKSLKSEVDYVITSSNCEILSFNFLEQIAEVFRGFILHLHAHARANRRFGDSTWRSIFHEKKTTTIYIN